MAAGSQGDLTLLLKKWNSGDDSSMEVIAAVVDRELRNIAEGYLRRERAGHTLQPTALVNEAWLRLVRQEELDFDSRKHFFALAAQIMRQVLVDYARASRSAKRGSGVTPVRIEGDGPGATVAGTGTEAFLILDDALTRLAARHPRHCRILELRYFGGLGVQEVASILDVSIATVSRDQKFAEALLSRMMSEPASGGVKTSAIDSAR